MNSQAEKKKKKRITFHRKSVQASIVLGEKKVCKGIRIKSKLKTQGRCYNFQIKLAEDVLRDEILETSNI